MLSAGSATYLSKRDSNFENDPHCPPLQSALPFTWLQRQMLTDWSQGPLAFVPSTHWLGPGIEGSLGGFGQPVTSAQTSGVMPAAGVTSIVVGHVAGVPGQSLQKAVGLV